MQSSSCEQWSLTRSLAFLAAIFAIMLGSLLPSTALAVGSATTVMLCSGDRMVVALDADGRPTPDEPAPLDAMKCPLCVLAGTATPMLPPPELGDVVQAPVIHAPKTHPLRVAQDAEPSPWTRRLPPPTAPPAA
ncbi:DUF2946 family protein [Brevundimonas sp.]|uniref:DUF2946 family protein n=1 Tax=Brevundimonas sp. TaxID=1871086 RepID=UPI003457A20C